MVSKIKKRLQQYLLKRKKKDERASERARERKKWTRLIVHKQFVLAMAVAITTAATEWNETNENPLF